MILLPHQSGIPESSVLGPLFFSIIHLSDNLYGVITVLFADDITMIVSGHSISQKH